MERDIAITRGHLLDLDRCAALIGEHDLGAGAVGMAGALYLLPRDLLIDFWTQKELLPPKQS